MIDTLGNDWQRVKNAEVLMETAKNQSAGGSGATLGIGLAAFSQISNIISNSFQTNDKIPEDFSSKLKKLKRLLDENVISKEDFENKKNQILSNI